MSFTKDNLHMENGWPKLTCKASETGLLGQWLEDELSQWGSCGAQLALAGVLREPAVRHRVLSFVGAVVFDKPAALFTLSNLMLRTFAECPDMFLSRAERRIAVNAGKGALTTYGSLSREHRASKIFKCLPKLHALQHIILELINSPPDLALNPWPDCCWMDEDMIGRVCRQLIKKSSPMTVLTRPVELYLSLMSSHLKGLSVESLRHFEA